MLADVSRILADRSISIEALIQKEPLAGETHLPIILITHRVLERDVDSAIAAIEALPTIKAPVHRIRLETLK